MAAVVDDAKEVTLELTLTGSEWCELYNAVEVKRVRIENGEYEDDALEGDGCDLGAWAKELLSVQTKLAAVLEKNNIVY